MTKHDLMEMAHQIYGDQDWTESTLTRLEHFANLVAAKERRACASVCAELGEWACVHDIEARGEQA